MVLGVVTGCYQSLTVSRLRLLADLNVMCEFAQENCQSGDFILYQRCILFVQNRLSKGRKGCRTVAYQYVECAFLSGPLKGTYQGTSQEPHQDA